MPTSCRTHIPALTGLRGLAAVLVLLFHLPLKNIWGLADEPPIVRNGFFGVDLFFILSGFILFHVHGRDFSRSLRFRLRSFAVSRTMRIFPLHLAVLAVILLTVLASEGFATWYRARPGMASALSLPGFFQTLTLTNGLDLPDLGHWNTPSWSLSAEMAGYATFPLVAYLCGTLGSRTQAWLVAFVSLAAYCVVMTGLVPLDSHLFRMETCFVAGAALARAYHLEPEFPAGPALAAGGAALLLAFLAIDRAAASSVFGSAALIYGLALGGSPLERLLQSRPVLYLGEISFSLYLSHFMVLAFLLYRFDAGSVSAPHPLVTTALLVLVPLAVASAFHRLVEGPSHRLARTLAQRVKATETEPTPA